jgi:hypothetical protein
MGAVSTQEKRGARRPQIGSMSNPNLRYLDAVEEALESVLPAAPLEFQIGGQRLSLKQRWLYFREYTGPHPKNSLGKPIVGVPDRPFAELQAVKRLEHQGWTCSERLPNLNGS